MRMLSRALQEQYGEKVYKLSLSSGCTCPNRDGTVGVGGCAFCSEGGSGDFAAKVAPIDAQILDAKQRIARKTDAKRFIAYFQSFTNTYGDVDRLEALYRETLERPEIVALSLGTRPDCLGPKVMAMLERLNECKPVWVELGLQTAHDETAARMNRGYSLETFTDAYRRLKAAGLTVIVHLIFGLPGESRQDMLDTVRFVAGLQPAPDGVKLQMLHVLKGTALGAQYAASPFPLLCLEEYAELIAESVRILPEDTVYHRLTGDAPGPLLLAPEWTRNKKRVLNTIHRTLREQNNLTGSLTNDTSAKVKSIQIISVHICYGPCPAEDDAVEQRLTVSSSGQVWFSERNYRQYAAGRGFCRNTQRNIGSRNAESLLRCISDLPKPIGLTDCGQFDISIRYADGTTRKLHGPMIGDAAFGEALHDPLTKTIRQAVPIPALWVFG